MLTRKNINKRNMRSKSKAEQLQKGTCVEYYSKEGFLIANAIVVDIHYDHKIPYYTIELLNNTGESTKREIQTLKSRLVPISNIERP